MEYYARYIIEVAKILNKTEKDIPRNIALRLEEFLGDGEPGASYCKAKKRITYQYKKAEGVLEDKGRLIHEAAHVVQDYPFELKKYPISLCWAEGIADYCRLKLDRKFRKEESLPCEPEKGYGYAAYFLEWLSNKHESIVADLNQLIYDRRGSIKSHDEIFFELLQTSFNDLKRECIWEKSER